MEDLLSPPGYGNRYAAKPMMWSIDDIEIRDVELDFTSSSGSRPRTQAIYAGDTCLVNALSYAELGDDPTQLIVCEACGFVQCQSGGWVHLRRIGDSIAFIPAFSEMLSGDFELTEFSPPAFTSARGTPLFVHGAYERLRVQVPAFPATDNLKAITAGEAVRLIQWHAPLRILGRFPNKPQLVRRAILAISDGQLDIECDQLQRFLDTNVDSSAELSVVGTLGSAPIEFHLDGPGYPAWRPVARIGDELIFNLEPAAQLMVAAQNAA